MGRCDNRILTSKSQIQKSPVVWKLHSDVRWESEFSLCMVACACIHDLTALLLTVQWIFFDGWESFAPSVCHYPKCQSEQTSPKFGSEIMRVNNKEAISLLYFSVLLRRLNAEMMKTVKRKQSFFYSYIKWLQQITCEFPCRLWSSVNSCRSTDATRMCWFLLGNNS